jgi:hypothetical protein
MNSFSKNKALGVLSTLLCLSVIWSAISFIINNKLEQGIDRQKLKTEALLSEKLLLEKAAEKNKQQFERLSLSHKSSLQTLEAHELKLADALLTNKYLKRMLKNAESKNESQSRIQQKLEYQMRAEKSLYANLLKENQKLRDSILHLTVQSVIDTNEMGKLRDTSNEHGIDFVRSIDEKIE